MRRCEADFPCRPWRANLLGSIAVTIGLLAGCAPAPGPVPPPLEPVEATAPEVLPPEVVLPPDEPVAGIDETERLRGALAAETDPERAASLRLELAERLEREGRPDEAAILYATLSGASPGSPHASEAWDGIARIRETEGDASGAVRGRMRAWEAAGAAERSGRTADLRRALQKLPTAEIRELARDASGLEVRSQVEAELAARTAGGATAGDGFPIAVLAPFTGRFEKFGAAFLLGARIALEDRDASPDSVSGRAPARAPVRVVVRDTEGDLLVATNAARDVILEEGARAILGPLLSVTSIGAGTVAQAWGVPLVAPAATDPGVSEIGRFVLTLDASARELAEPLADFAVGGLQIRRFGVLVPQEHVAEELEREFRRAVEERGGEVVVTVSYASDRTDFRRLLERIDEANVQAVYMPGGVADLEKLAPQLEFYEFRRRVLGHGGWMSPRVLDAGNLALEGGVFAVTASERPDSEFSRHLRDRVWSRTGEEVSRFHQLGYRAMASVLAAVDLGARSGEEIVEVLRRRQHWSERPAGERIDVVTFRDGALGPADWAIGFDLTPPVRPEDREEEVQAGKAAGRGGAPGSRN